ncbi:cell envelope biogenesis protein OmpA [Aquimarina sp. AD10]|uniref:Cell envelope biogenesis protein OmpA n=1 Tax=Aquimarina aggregata TaxID=1642818 RepID=A0A163CDC8_9FLAO|nr:MULTISPECIES: OmpA family protein [Aquimarina]AXT59718.1 cell envelope biogenesis protein OmpA [Aquimarina sp. AD10]KZS42292.1 cell envelope biogenesis protein OmpA [Aquimarina aggregata]RKM97594.1 cell envelope biogenesis protein OmpA [Aquimarina sp. AD10]
MKKSFAFIALSGVILMTSCVSKKKYVALEQQLQDTQSTLQRTAVEKEELEGKFAKIEARVADYNSKINSLKDSNNEKMVMVDGIAAISNNTKAKMGETLSKVDPQKLQGAKTLKDSMNLAVSHNLKSSLSDNLKEDEDISINIDNTVVMISISDKMLFNSGSFRVSNKADDILKKLADVINSEPSLEVMVEGHTDPRTISTAVVQDNWDLSVKRATSIIRKLQNSYNVDPAKLIASGRSSYKPLVENDTQENMAINRRTRIVLLPNMDKFFAMLSSN